jgi:hypothetical protein
MLRGLDELGRRGQPVPDWILGGGTALMILADHRLSKDIDAFIDDPPYLALLSPDTTDVSGLFGLGSRRQLSEAEISGRRDRLHRHGGDLEIASGRANHRSGRFEAVDPVGCAAEIALKKLHYRATMLKARDVFDIAVIDATSGDTLNAHLHEVADKKSDLLRRLDGMKEDYLRDELAELDIRPRWEKQKQTCLETVKAIVARIPDSARR